MKVQLHLSCDVVGGGWRAFGLCAEFPSLSWLAATPEAALKGIRKVVAQTVDDLQQSGEEVPEPFSDRRYSGRFMVRVPPEVHRGLATRAAEEGVSLNRLVSEIGRRGLGWIELHGPASGELMANL